MKKKILVTLPLQEAGLKGLKSRFDVMEPKEGKFTRDEILAILPEFHGVLAAGIPMDGAMMERAKNLEIISVYGAGYDHIDIEKATEHNILVANAPDSVTEATAEMAFGLMIDIMRNISMRDRWLRENPDSRWGMFMDEGQNLWDKTIGIIGLGRIGKAMARRCRAFGMEVIYFNRNPLSGEMERELGVRYLPFDELLRVSDVVSLHTPLTSETRHLIGERELSLMKPSSYLINTARGEVVDEWALIRHLQKGGLAGAGLDVFEREPYIPKELLSLQNVVMTPHIGTATKEVRLKMTEETAQNIIDYFEGRMPISVVNP